MEFANPIWLIALFLAPVLLVLLSWGGRRRQSASIAFTGDILNDSLAPGRSWRKNLLKVLLKVGTYMLLVLALARPQFGKQLVKVEREGIDIVVALDVSLSMLAEDMKPNRLDRAKQEIMDLISGLKGDRIGMVAFAGDAVVLCPLTVDYNAARMFASSANIDLVSMPGSALHKAIDTSLGLFPESEGHDGAIILVTDGEGHTGDPIAAAKKAAAVNVRVYTIGIGHVRGELIPLRGTDGASSGYKKDRAGETVLTRLDETTLRGIAKASGGKFLPATREGLELQVLYKEISGLDAKTIEGEFMERRQDRFVWFLGLALLLFGLDGVVSSRGSRSGTQRRRLHTGAAMALMFLIGMPATADAGDKKVDRKRVKSGNQYYASGEYQKALSLYRESIGDSLAMPKHAEGVRYNEANALHMLGEYEQALNHYNRSFADGDSLQAGRMLYNRANTLLEMSKFDDAIESYLQALQYIPDDADARHNLEMAVKMKQQQEQQQQQQDDQNQEQQEEQEQNQDQQGDEEQDQQQQEQPDSTQTQQPDSTQTAQPDSTQVQSIELTLDDALRILQLLEEREQELQKQKRKAAFKRSTRGKDW